jgi:mevalonate kinase
MTVASACGKVILLGEHSVVYGQPALAAGLSPGAEARFDKDISSDSVLLSVEGITDSPLVARVGDSTDLARALSAMLASASTMLSVDQRAFRGSLWAKLHLPAGGGVGSSAALGVACARAVALAFADSPLSTEQAIELGMSWEKVFHGNPSGLDHTLAAYGGAGVFVRGEGFTRVQLRAPLRVLFADTGERTPTKDTVAAVAKLRERRPEVVDKTCEAIGVLVRNAVLALQEHDLRALGQLMDLNQNLLSSLMVSTPRTEELCRLARENGAYGAKLTGGGGGGCVIAIAPDDCCDRICSSWKSAGASVFDATIHGG